MCRISHPRIVTRCHPNVRRPSDLLMECWHMQASDLFTSPFNVCVCVCVCMCVVFLAWSLSAFKERFRRHRSTMFYQTRPSARHCDANPSSLRPTIYSFLVFCTLYAGKLCLWCIFIRRPFVKRFALCYRTVVCLSVLSVCNVDVIVRRQTV